MLSVSNPDNGLNLLLSVIAIVFKYRKMLFTNSRIKRRIILNLKICFVSAFKSAFLSMFIDVIKFNSVYEAGRLSPRTDAVTDYAL